MKRRLIDAESPQNRMYVSDLVIEEMKKIPTVDIDRPTRSQFKRMAVQLGYEPVVRCGGCQHWRHNLENETYCSIVGGLADPEEDDFCSYGEKRSDFVDDNKIGERRADEQ